MIAVITGDIINSRKISNAPDWLNPFKALLESGGKSPEYWEIYRGDSFQVKVEKAETVFWQVLRIKALIKSLSITQTDGSQGRIDVRMAVGIGQEGFNADRITESNGDAFIRSGDQFEKLQSAKVNLSLQSPWPDWD